MLQTVRGRVRRMADALHGQRERRKTEQQQQQERWYLDELRVSEVSWQQHRAGRVGRERAQQEGACKAQAQAEGRAEAPAGHSPVTRSARTSCHRLLHCTVCLLVG